MISRRRAAVGTLLVMVLAMTLLEGGLWRGRGSKGRVLEVELRTSAGTNAQIFWDDGTGFSDVRSSRAPLRQSPDTYQIVPLVLPNSNIQALRFDPSDAPAEILIRRMLVRDPLGAQIAELNPGSLLPLNHVASMVREGDLTRITTPPTGTDPAFLVTVACLDGRAAWYELSSVTPLSLALAVAIVLSLAAASIWVVLRELLELTHASRERNHARVWRVVLWMVVLLGLTVSAKLYLLREFPFPVPSLDQWHAEPTSLYVPFAEGCLSWKQMLSFHNEHRVFLPRLQALSLLVINSQWDPQVQQLANAVVHAATGAFVAAMLFLGSGRRRMDLAVLSCVLVFAIPFGWENVVVGFQSAFYLLLLFSTLALWLTLQFAPGTRPWALGYGCAAACLFTSAGGIVTAAVLALTTLVRMVRLPASPWRVLANLLPAVALLTIGVMLMPPPMRASGFGASSSHDFVTAMGRNLSWPWVDHPWLWLLLWGPLIVLVALRWSRRQTEDAHREGWMYALGLWVILNAAILAYGRGAGGQAPAARYMDVLSLGTVVNMGAVSSLAGLLPLSRPKRLISQACLSAWVIFLVAGVDRVTHQTFGNMVAVSAWFEQYKNNLRHFVTTDDLSTLASKKFPFEVPVPDPVYLGNALLRHPYVRQILPPEIRQPMLLSPARVTNDAFARNGVYPTTPSEPLRPAWGSYTARQNLSQGTFESMFTGECGAALLRFDVAGYLPAGGLSLSVQSVHSGRETPLQPREPAREQWAPIFTPCRSPLRVVAKDENPELWFAFRDPIEYGRLSWLARQLIDHSRGLLLCSAALMLIALRIGPAEGRTRTVPPTSSP